ncbi:hypothetical protein [Sphingobacterium sp. CZ-UAM]|uniref:hypothetical protein n=1 Tax=Sphingobacterium sp. CZ-UAM TaxID=1933868 RepID=UPI0009865312|nr:hypothetical protein [Sphingobacterium sp. CZ-UAM]
MTLFALNEALAWSKKSLEEGENPIYLNTYANLLYRSGDKDGGIQWKERAIAKADPEDKEKLTETLEKMKKGEKIGKIVLKP